MMLKIFVTVVLAIVGFVIAARLTGGPRPQPRVRDRRSSNAAEQGIGRLAKCAKCGIYLPAESQCTCDAHG